MNLEELWIEFGVGKARKYIPIRESSNILGANICRSISFWHSFTSCATVSCFHCKGKKTGWKMLRLFEEGQETFLRYELINFFNGNVNMLSYNFSSASTIQVYSTNWNC